MCQVNPTRPDQHKTYLFWLIIQPAHFAASNCKSLIFYNCFLHFDRSTYAALSTCDFLLFDLAIIWEYSPTELEAKKELLWKLAETLTSNLYFPFLVKIVVLFLCTYS